MKTRRRLEDRIEQFNKKKCSVWNKIRSNRFDQIVDPVEVEIYGWIKNARANEQLRLDIIDKYF